MGVFKNMLRRVTGKNRNMVHGSTDVGKERAGNEDCYLILPQSGIYIVADGMGGHNAGEIASMNAVKALGEYFTEDTIAEMRYDEDLIPRKLKNAVIYAHKRVIEISESNSAYNGMGSTIAISFINNNILHTCHVGDSRIYVITKSNIIQITRDHSTVSELVRIGKMTREQARRSPLKNRITQALGVPIPIKPEYNRTYRLNKGDIVLMCSDGLWDMLPDRDIRNIVLVSESLGGACDDLIRAANEAGGDDNITVILIQIGDAKEGETTEVRRQTTGVRS
jgi:protein phosphatase